jgi:hypothetical protein
MEHRYKFVTYDEHHINKTNQYFAIKLTDPKEHGLSWLKQFHNKCDELRLWYPRIEDYEVLEYYGMNIPPDMRNDSELLKNHSTAIKKLLFNKNIVDDEFRHKHLILGEGGYIALYKIIEMFHPKLNPHIGIEPPGMGTNTITQHVQAIVSYLELMRLGNQVSYVDALKKSLQTFVHPYDLIRTERLNIRNARHEEQLDECYQFKNIKAHLTSQVADLQRTTNDRINSDDYDATALSAMNTHHMGTTSNGTQFTQAQKQQIAAIAESAFATHTRSTPHNNRPT